MIAGVDTWGGLFMISPPGLKHDQHLQIIAGLGFTVVAVDHFSGRSDAFCFGPNDSVAGIINDYTLGFEIRPYFFRLPPGVEITEALIRGWANRQDIVFIE
jgi:hypothetical protein